MNDSVSGLINLQHLLEEIILIYKMKVMGLQFATIKTTTTKAIFILDRSLHVLFTHTHVTRIRSEQNRINETSSPILTILLISIDTTNNLKISVYRYLKTLLIFILKTFFRVIMAAVIRGHWFFFSVRLTRQPEFS